MTEQMNVKNINTRTLCIEFNEDTDKLLREKFAETIETSKSNNNSHVYYVCDTIDTAKEVYGYLKDELNLQKISLCYYSLFMKFKGKKTDDDTVVNELKKFMESNTQYNFTFHRIDNNGFTGKLCVDKFNDYTSLKDGEFDSFNFYHFSPRTNTNPNQQNGNNFKRSGNNYKQNGQRNGNNQWNRVGNKSNNRQNETTV
jgi:hypothetical protein